MIRAKRSAHLVWQTNRLPSDKLIFSRLKDKLKRQIQKFQNINYDNYINNVSTNHGNF